MKKKHLYLIYILFFSTILSVLVANRSEYITADYNIYQTMYYNSDARMSELTFNFLRYIFSDFNGGFIYLLFVYAFFSMVLKFSILIDQNKINILFFILFYFASFFPLWEMTQIRISLAISIFIFSFFYFSKIRNFLIIFSLFFHYSMIFFIIPYYIYVFFRRSLFLNIVLNFLIALSVLVIIKYTPYIAYDANDYIATYSFFL